MRREIIVSVFSILAAGLACAQRRRIRAARTLRHRARRLCLSLPRQPAAACQRRRAAADGLYGRGAGTAERAHGAAAARPQFSLELLGAGHQDAGRSRLPRRGAGPDRLRQILKTARRAAFRHAGAQHHRAARSPADRQGRHRRAFARRHARRSPRPRFSRSYQPSRADRADRARGLPPLRAADADREDHRERGQADAPRATASSSRPIIR